MKRTIGLTIACVLAIPALAWSWTPSQAQVPPQITLTFRLTINGTVPSSDGFDVNWAENGLTMCAPRTCAGEGHIYVQTMLWPQGPTAIQFHFTRARVAANGTVSQRQAFGQQTVTAQANRAISASFTYASASAISVPATGAEPPVVVGGSLIVAGVFMVGVALRRRRTAKHRTMTAPRSA